MQEPLLNYDEASDTLYVSLSPGESTTGIELNEHVLLRINIEEQRAVGLTFFDYSVLAQKPDLGLRGLPLAGLTELSEELRGMVLGILRQPPVSDILVLSGNTPSISDPYPAPTYSLRPSSLLSSTAMGREHQRMGVSLYQIRLPGLDVLPIEEDYRGRLAALLAGNLDYHDQISDYASHNLHSFPAKFPPQLPRDFILGLTDPGDVVLDPMAGSGTTIVEALLAGRRGVGLDIDPLALRINGVKTTPLDADRIVSQAQTILREANASLVEARDRLQASLQARWDESTRQFVDYWFAPQTQLELAALVDEIARVSDPHLRSFFELAFSSIIVTKSGGVSLALDLGHTRPHKARFVYSRSGQLLHGPETSEPPSRKDRVLTKTVRPALEEFNKRVQANTRGLSFLGLTPNPLLPFIGCSDAQYLPLRDESVDLIVTSPPYASNAIDYMRAHKFSLVWLGHSVDELGELRKGYVGGEALADIQFEDLPPHTAGIVETISALDRKKGQVLRRYFAEMTRALREMYRVLKPGKAAIVVVGSSVMRGRDTETQLCLAEIGRTIGFAGGSDGDGPSIGVRNLDRNRRMMPAGAQVNLDSMIQQRMHQEYVIGFYKPRPGER